MSFRSLTRLWLPSHAKRALQQLVLGYHSYVPSFSSAGEDMVLRHLVGCDKRDGFYVDVGAYDPIVFSNTHFFYLRGWRGINIEARPGSRSRFEQVRPRDINVEVGVSRRAGELTYYVIDEGSPMNSFSRGFLERIGVFGQVTREVSLHVRPLAELLEQHLPGGQIIDFMNVDVEGHDLDVIESNDWDRFRPRFLLVESRHDIDASPVVNFLTPRGYEVCGYNAMVHEYFFVDRSR